MRKSNTQQDVLDLALGLCFIRWARTVPRMTVTDFGIPTELGNNIRAEMARKRKTQTQLAAMLGLSQSGVSERLNGRVEFSASQLYRVSEWLDVSVSALLPDPTYGASTRQYLADSADFAAAA